MIYCVEDDAGIRDLMVYTLNSTGLKATGLADSKELYAALQRELPQMILLDIMLPGEDGISILKHLRASAKTANIPVIMATAKSTEYDKVIGLDLGADDYLAKPFGMMEMVSRVKAVLRRTVANNNIPLLKIGDISLNISEHLVLVKGQRVILTLKEFELLRVLMENPGQVFTRDQLLTSIWGYDFDGETRTVDVHIRTLRQKLGLSGDYIKTIRGIGYRLEESYEAQDI